MGPQIQRCDLRFECLGDAVRQAESLRLGGYERAGSWDLSQVCGHLAEWMGFPLDGFPHQPAPIRLVLWGLRNTIGRRELRRLLDRGVMPRGGPTIETTIPSPGGNEAEAVERLRRAVTRFEAHDGPLCPSPIFGVLDRVQWRRLQLIHCAHHLGFLRPNSQEGLT
jgi:hypothetical protein